MTIIIEKLQQNKENYCNKSQIWKIKTENQELITNNENNHDGSNTIYAKKI